MFIMKIYFAAAVCIWVGMSAEGYEELRHKYIKAAGKCSPASNFYYASSKDYVQKLLKGGLNAQSFSECIFRELGQLGQNEEILYDEVKNEPFPFDPSNAVCNLVDICQDEKGSTTKETAWKFQKCLLEKSRKW
ncbi:hypothetical protein FQA39_LY02460 [Lamprigera yunnana]|nr:hypothetical protein FQA39_LY02460 [Lamprigera yunnana]